nr:DNA repair endonuclease XPF [Haemonchus contortus]
MLAQKLPLRKDVNVGDTCNRELETQGKMNVEIKQEIISDDEEVIENDPCHGTVEILEYEQRLLLSTMDEDVIFIHARGLGMERMFFNHLIMYSDQKLLTIVLNTTPQDEAANAPCMPKVLNADISTKDREAVYLEGGVQFLTSRILLVDLLTNRVPIKNVAGILVYRAHQILSSFQESFILRLYRERKPGGFVKAFTDLPTSVSALGQLQRVIDRLYIRSVRLIPRFDADVKQTLERTPPALSELIVDLPPVLRRVHTTFVELLKVCIRELKQCSTAEKQATLEEDTTQVAVYRPTLLERQLGQRRSFLTDKQSRLLSDLTMLRELLQVAEDMDPATVLSRINAIRNDKEVFERSGTWMMSRVATSLIADVETLCGYGAFKSRPFVAPPKWQVLASVIDEIKGIPVRKCEVGPDGPSVLIFVNDDAVVRQVTDLIRNGPEFLCWMTRRSLGGGGAGKEPPRSPLWDIDDVTPFQKGNLTAEPRKEMISDLQKNTLVTARASRRRRKAAEDLVGSSDTSKRQTKLLQFGILQYKKRRSDDTVRALVYLPVYYEDLLYG